MYLSVKVKQTKSLALYGIRSFKKQGLKVNNLVDFGGFWGQSKNSNLLY